MSRTLATVTGGHTLRELIVAAQDTGHWAVAGTPEQPADAVEERFRAGVLDVLSLNGLANPVQHDYVVKSTMDSGHPTTLPSACSRSSAGAASSRTTT
jgi:alkanesulfonate monooxygenase SsuD/methylene tetrahydromethanopterin reductase-like flavin-dependent oxidoreductase (luciferase family)